MGLLEVRGRRAIAARGARLLRARREVLAGELFRVVREVLEGRARLDRALRGCVEALALARALEGDAALASLAAAAAREISVGVEVRRVWGVATAAVSAPALVRAGDGRGSAPSSWSPTAAEAARRHELALELVLGIATRELHLTRVAEEVAETSRRIEGIEQLVLPALAKEARRISTALEEREREDAVRLKRLRRRRLPPERGGGAGRETPDLLVRDSHARRG
jgi:V/A-type H+-transporting ATPase subunit D